MSPAADPPLSSATLGGASKVACMGTAGINPALSSTLVLPRSETGSPAAPLRSSSRAREDRRSDPERHTARAVAGGVEDLELERAGLEALALRQADDVVDRSRIER